MGRKSKKTKIQLFLNKYYMPLLLVFVFGILLTAAIIDKNKKYESNNSVEPIIMEQGWSLNEETDKSIKIYGSDILSTEASTDDVYHEYYCQTDECLFIHGNDNYALMDDGKYMVYSLIGGTVFDISKNYDLDESEFLVHNNTLYGLIFNNGDNEIYYSLNHENYFFENDKYFIDRTSSDCVANNQLLLFDNDKYYLYDLNTKKVLVESFRIEINYVEQENDYYFTTYDTRDKVSRIYTSDMHEITVNEAQLFTFINKKFIYTLDKKVFMVKNINDELILSSKTYDEIYDFVYGYIIAKAEDKLLIINQSDEVIKEIPLDGYNYDNYRSYYDTLDKNGFHLFFNNDLETKEIFFNPETLEYYQINN